MYTAFVALRSDCIDTYGDNASYSIHPDDALYDTLPKTSILWSVGDFISQRETCIVE